MWYNALMMKICTKCKIELPATAQFFYRDKSAKQGLNSQSKACCRIRTKRYEQTEKGKEASRKSAKRFHQRHPNRTKRSMRNSFLKKKYGIDLQKYNEMLGQQGECCLICGKHRSKVRRDLSVDHNHKTGKVRGLLCDGCNFMLSVLENDVFIKYAKIYLETFGDNYKLP